MKKFLLYFLLLLAFAGVVDTGYLLVQTVSGQAVVCPSVPIGRFNLNQCDIVLATSYAKFMGLPMALYGLGAYLLFVILILYELNNKRTMKILAYLSGAGVLISAYFIYLQFFVINALCFYCLTSATIITLIFILSIAYNFKYFSNRGA